MEGIKKHAACLARGRAGSRHLSTVIPLPSRVCSVLPGEGSRLGDDVLLQDVLVRVLGVVSPGHPLAPRRDPATQLEPPAHSLLGPLRARPPGEPIRACLCPAGEVTWHPGTPAEVSPTVRGRLGARMSVRACLRGGRPGVCVRVHRLSWSFRSSQAWRGAWAPGAECGPRWASFGALWSEQSWLRVSVQRNGAPLPAGESPGLHRADLRTRLAAPLPARPRAAPPARVSSQSQARKPRKGQVGAGSWAGHTAP